VCLTAPPPARAHASTPRLAPPDGWLHSRDRAPHRIPRRAAGSNSAPLPSWKQQRNSRRPHWQWLPASSHHWPLSQPWHAGGRRAGSRPAGGIRAAAAAASSSTSKTANRMMGQDNTLPPGPQASGMQSSGRPAVRIFISSTHGGPSARSSDPTDRQHRVKIPPRQNPADDRAGWSMSSHTSVATRIAAPMGQTTPTWCATMTSLL
jgi:hypothetical protein